MHNPPQSQTYTSPSGSSSPPNNDEPNITPLSTQHRFKNIITITNNNSSNNNISILLPLLSKNALEVNARDINILKTIHQSVQFNCRHSKINANNINESLQDNASSCTDIIIDMLLRNMDPYDSTIDNSTLPWIINATHTAKDQTICIDTHVTSTYPPSVTPNSPKPMSIIQVLQYTIAIQALAWTLSGYNAYTYAYDTHATINEYDKAYNLSRH